MQIPATGTEMPTARVAAPSTSGAVSPPGARLVARGRATWHERWLSSSTWKGAGAIALLCLLNALRRNADAFGDKASQHAWLVDFPISFGTGALLALLIALAVVATYHRVPAKPQVRYPALVAAVLFSSALGAAIVLPVEQPLMSANPTVTWMSTWPRYALLGILFSIVYVYFKRAERSAAEARQAEQERALLDEQMQEARLQVLQAQIEPHFLFNTLATVRRLYQTERNTAASTLDSLMQYLTVALPQMRVGESTLGREVSLAEAYLNVQRMRMGRRLTFAIDVNPSLRSGRLPPMMLLTLTENAIKHGLGPLPEGGFLRISARVDGQELAVQVADSGQGFTKTAGGGTGLANIRARLAAAYGAAGRLSVRLNSPRGVTATITLPYSRAASAAAVSQ